MTVTKDTSKSEDVPLTEAELKKIAIDLLSRRDQRQQELAQKLKQKGGEPELVSLVLAWCQL